MLLKASMKLGKSDSILGALQKSLNKSKDVEKGNEKPVLTEL